MTGSVVAFFTCSALAVAPSISLQARETAGVVTRIDPEAGVLRLADGSEFGLPDGFDLARVTPGTVVHLVYEPATG